MSNISTEQISLLLKEKERQLGNLESISTNSREKLKKLNVKLNKTQKQLIEILSMVQHEEVELINMDTIQTPNINNIYVKIEQIQESLRKIRGSLVDLIRNE
jgi:hypothetical protein